MVKVYTKSPLTFEQQLQQLKNRGLVIDNDDFALSPLRTISYNRLSAYWHPFRKIEKGGAIADDFEEGTQFNEVMKLYEFERRLRLLVMVNKEIGIGNKIKRSHYNALIGHERGMLRLHVPT